MKTNNDSEWMLEAYKLALQAQKNNEVPVGAIIVSDDETVIGSGYNQMIQANDPTAHAEIVAIRQAAHNMHNYRLENATLYVTLEPCTMCVGAISHARIKRLVFAARDFKAGAAGSLYNLLPHIQVDEGYLQQQCSRLLINFFKLRRLRS